MLISVNVESMPSFFAVMFACAVLLVGYCNSLRYDGFPRIRVLT